MIILAEAAEQLEPSASARDIAASAGAARLAGASVYTIPASFDACETAENALLHIPARAVRTAAFWVGYIPEPSRYAAIYGVARAKNLLLLNSPDQHLDAQEFDRAYPKIADLTARSVFVTAADSALLSDALDALGGPPVFVKGAVQSRKAAGWKACVAETREELAPLVAALLRLADRSRGRVVLRELLPPRIAGHAPNGFPMGREFRVFVFNGAVVGIGYYWEGDHGGAEKLSCGDDNAIRALAREATRHVGSPYIAVDIGQLMDGIWCVIETGDAQFSGLSRVPKIEFWNRLRHDVAKAPNPPASARLSLRQGTIYTSHESHRG